MHDAHNIKIKIFFQLLKNFIKKILQKIWYNTFHYIIFVNIFNQYLSKVLAFCLCVSAQHIKYRYISIVLSIVRGYFFLSSGSVFLSIGVYFSIALENIFTMKVFSKIMLKNLHNTKFFCTFV